MEIGQWDLPWQPRWARGAENLMARMVSLALPQSVIRWALTRALVHATHPRWGDTIALGAATIPISVVALRWELRVPARRLPFFPEWMRAYMSH